MYGLQAIKNEYRASASRLAAEAAGVHVVLSRSISACWSGTASATFVRSMGSVCAQMDAGAEKLAEAARIVESLDAVLTSSADKYWTARHSHENLVRSQPLMAVAGQSVFVAQMQAANAAAERAWADAARQLRALANRSPVLNRRLDDKTEAELRRKGIEANVIVKNGKVVRVENFRSTKGGIYKPLFDVVRTRNRNTTSLSPEQQVAIAMLTAAGRKDIKTAIKFNEWASLMPFYGVAADLELADILDALGEKKAAKSLRKWAWTGVIPAGAIGLKGGKFVFKAGSKVGKALKAARATIKQGGKRYKVATSAKVKKASSNLAAKRRAFLKALERQMSSGRGEQGHIQVGMLFPDPRRRPLPVSMRPNRVQGASGTPNANLPNRPHVKPLEDWQRPDAAQGAGLIGRPPTRRG